MKISSIKREIFLFLQFFGFFSVFSYYYINVESIRNAYLERPEMLDLSLKSISNFIFISLILLLINRLVKGLKRSIYLLLVFFYIIPLLAINNSISFSVSVLFLSFIFCLVLGKNFSFSLSEKNINYKFIKFPNYIWFALVIIILSSFLTYSMYGFHLQSVNFQETYNVRDKNRGVGVGSIGAYMFSFTLYILCPLLISYSIKNKRKLILLISIIALLISFFANANKITLMILLISLIVPFLKVKKINNYIGPFFVLFYATGIFFFGYLQYDLLNFAIGRLFVLPAVSTTFFVEFANNNSYYFFQDWNFIGGLISDVFNVEDYNVSKTFKIGENYSDWDGNNFNSTLWANGYLDGGFIVVTLFTIIIAKVFKYLCSLSTSRPEIISYIFILIVLCLEKSINGLLLSGGLGFFFLCYFFTKTIFIKSKNNIQQY